MSWENWEEHGLESDCPQVCMSGSNGQWPILFNWLRDQHTQFNQVRDMVGPHRPYRDIMHGIIAWALDGCVDKYIAWIHLSTFPTSPGRPPADHV